MAFLRHKPTESALALVLDVDRSAWTADSSVSGGGGRSISAKVRLRVTPDDEPAFESEAKVWGMDAVQQLAPGRETYVRYEPEHTSRCDIDRDRLRSEFGPGRNGKDRVVVLTDAQADFEDRLTARERDPAAYAEHRRDVLASAAAAHEHAQAITSARPAAPTSGDPLDRLQKLADLHDRGALTDAEFAAEKAKILNEI